MTDTNDETTETKPTMSKQIPFHVAVDEYHLHRSNTEQDEFVEPPITGGSHSEAGGPRMDPDPYQSPSTKRIYLATMIEDIRTGDSNINKPLPQSSLSMELESGEWIDIEHAEIRWIEAGSKADLETSDAIRSIDDIPADSNVVSEPREPPSYDADDAKVDKLMSENEGVSENE